MKQLKTVLIFEYMSLLRSKVFIITTVVMVVLLFCLPLIPTIIGVVKSIELGGGDGSIAVLDDAQRFSDELLTSELGIGAVVRYSDVDEAKAAVNDGKHKYALQLEDSQFTMYVTSMEMQYYGIISNVEEMIKAEHVRLQMESLGILEEQIQKMESFKPHSEVISIGAVNEGSAADSDYMQSVGYVYFILMALYMAILMYGQCIIISVVREKSSKTMEVLLTSVKPTFLMFGKVLGTGLAGLTQMAILGLTAAASVAISGIVALNSGMLDLALSEMPEDFTFDGTFGLGQSFPMDILFYFVIFFILGFFLYSFLFAGFASSASRMEDANSVITIPMLFIIAAMFIAIYAMGTPGSVLVTVLSYFPLFTPMVMFVRICLHTASVWEGILSIVLLIGWNVVIGVLAARIYRMGTLMYGKPPKIKELAKALFSMQ